MRGHSIRVQQNVADKFHESWMPRISRLKAVKTIKLSCIAYQ